MFWKHITAFAALILVSAPCAAFDDSPTSQQSPGVMFYFSIPLDAKTPRQQMPALGLSFQGQRDFQRVTIDTRMFDAADRMGFGPFAGISAKWIVAGVVATGAVVAVASKDKSTSQSYHQQQQQQAAQQQQQQQQQQQNGGGGTGGGGGTVPCPASC